MDWSTSENITFGPSIKLHRTAVLLMNTESPIRNSANKKEIIDHINKVLTNLPSDWLKLTTHRLDIYHEELAKTEFLDGFEGLIETGRINKDALENLPTAYDYIRLGHPLSSVLEWTIAKLLDLPPESVISFSSHTAPILAVLRKNLLDKRATRILHSTPLPNEFDLNKIKNVYGYQTEIVHEENIDDITPFDGSSILMTNQELNESFVLPTNVDFVVNIEAERGSIILVNGEQNKSYISEIQHVRRRETIAMTPEDCFVTLKQLIQEDDEPIPTYDRQSNLDKVNACIKEVTNTDVQPVIGSSGLSVQYAIMMGLIDHALENHPGKDIKFLVPPNCYGGTNDQARRVAACIDNVEIMDLLVDREHDMVSSLDTLLDQVAEEDAVPYIIVEIPTNPRVEVPHLEDLKNVLCKKRTTCNGSNIVNPVFIVDQTFCPNVKFLGEEDILSCVHAISYVSGSKFPSGGKCTAGYCVANHEAGFLMEKINKHIKLCDNEATDLQVKILAEQMPSMLERIDLAYNYTKKFVEFIKENLPAAKINFVSDELASLGFTPSVFSLDLPTKGETDEEREAYKRKLNLQLINSMITKIPDESKYCVSYGQLKGCYWTIPATSTQGTTKEGDKDYIARVALSGNMNLDLHKKVFSEFVNSL